MLHEKKKQCLLSWVQSAGGHDVTSLSQLCDGKLLNELIITLSGRDCNVSRKSEIDPVETDSVKLSKASSEEEHELIKEIVDFSIKKIEGCAEEQESINGYHGSSTSQLDVRDVFSHSNVKEDDHVVSENGAVNENTKVVLNEITVNSDKGENAAIMDLSEFPVNGPLNIDCSDPQDYSSRNKNLDTDLSIFGDIDSAEIQRRYSVVQKFIESMLELKCTTLVNISQCFKGHELELAKLTVLLLSAMVQYSLSTNKDHIMASCYSLSPDAQEEIMDCLELFLKERQSPIERKEFHSRLCRRAKLRISPRKRSNVLSTPQPPRRGRKRKAYNDVESLVKGFESPIQNLIQSPDIRQITPNSEARLLEAVRCKDKTIALLTYDLDMEKYNMEDLKKQNEDLSFQLSKLKNDYKKLKEELNEVQTNLENNELTFEKAQNDWKKEVKSYESQIKELKNAEKFWKETFPAEDISTSKKLGCSCSEEISSLKCAMQAKDDKLKERQREVELLTVQLEKLSKSKLEENLESNNKTSNGRSSIQEKCFNISDLSLRNELKDKCEELRNLLKQREIELTIKTQKIEELLFQKDKIEKECKARLRKTDKEREDATNNQKKLEIENSNLKGQLKIFKNYIPELSSTFVPKNSTDSNSPPANRRSSRNRNVCDSEKIGQLWHTYDTEDNLDNNIIEIGSEQDEPCGESSTVIPHRIEMKLLNKKVSAKSHSKLCRSQSVSNITSKDLGTCEICSQNNFDDIHALMQNICKIVREDNILDADVLLELSKYEKGFEMRDLAVVLTLLNKILLDFSYKRTCSKYIRDQDQVEMSKLYEPEQVCEKGNATAGRSNLCPGESFINREILEKNKEILNKEKKKVVCLQNRLKNLKNLLNLKTKELEQLKVQLAKAENLRDTNIERCKTLMTENELKTKKIAKLKVENPEPIVQEVVKILPPPPCCNCIKLKEEIMLLKVQRTNHTIFAERLRSELENQNSINEDLKRELSKLSSKNSELEEKLSNPKIVDSGVYSPQLKTLREKLKASVYRNIPNELDDSEEKKFHDASTVTNCSFAVSSVGGMDNNNCNQATKTLRAFCKAEDEAEMLSQNSIFEMQNDTPNQRLKEINRRNTLCLPHLKSQYPLELNTTPSQHKYFQPPAIPSCSRNMSTRDKESIHQAKKRKISKPSVRSSFASILSSSRPSTPGSRIHPSSTPKVKTFISKLHKTNSSAARLHYRRFKDSLEK